MAEELNDKPFDNPSFSQSILWTAQRLLLIGFIARFKKNYDRYRPLTKNNDIPEGNTHYLSYLTHSITSKQQSFYHIFSNSDEQDEAVLNSSLLILNQQIYDLLYELHFRLLDFPVDDILPVIRHLDNQLAFWNTENLEWTLSEDFEIHIMTALNEMTLIDKLVQNIGEI